MSDPKPDDVDFHEETTDPLVADLRNFYKVEKWTPDGTKVDSLLYAADQTDNPATNTGVRSVATAARSYNLSLGQSGFR
jgi:hypothetical protein